MNTLPDFMIIGAMKCATSTLHEQLNNQPGIVMSEPKEIYFFSDIPVYAKGINWYAHHFENVPTNELCGESSTHYTKLPTYPATVDRIHKHVPNCKFVYVMRHPIDRLVSQYIHQWTEREISVGIDQAVDQHPELLDYSRYTMQLHPYFETFGRENVLPIFFDRLNTHPQKTIQQVCNFLGYTNVPLWDYGDEARNVSADRMRANPIRDAIIWSPPVTFIREKFVPQSFRNKVKEMWQMRNRPELTAVRKAQLAHIFDEELATLGDWLGVELNCDNFKEVTRANELNWV